MKMKNVYGVEEYEVLQGRLQSLARGENKMIDSVHDCSTFPEGCSVFRIGDSTIDVRSSGDVFAYAHSQEQIDVAKRYIENETDVKLLQRADKLEQHYWCETCGRGETVHYT